MAKFNEYTVKATPEDADTLMLYDATSKSNKLSLTKNFENFINMFHDFMKGADKYGN